jgi:hypothetical protein
MSVKMQFITDNFN